MVAFVFYHSVPIFVFPILIPKNYFFSSSVHFQIRKKTVIKLHALRCYHVFTMYIYLSSIYIGVVLSPFLVHPSLPGSRPITFNLDIDIRSENLPQSYWPYITR